MKLPPLAERLHEHVEANPGASVEECAAARFCAPARARRWLSRLVAHGFLLRTRQALPDGGWKRGFRVNPNAQVTAPARSAA